VIGLREILDDSSDIDSDHAALTDAPADRDQGAIQIKNNPLFSSALCPTNLASSTIISSEMSSRLLGVYYDRVDTIFKVGHWPSTLKSLKGHDKESFDSESVSVLRGAIEFMALCTLSEDECKQSFLLEKTTLIRIARQRAEQLFNEADLLTTTEIAVLQAFVIYLAGLRTCESSRANWVLISLAVRLATAMGIDIQPTSDMTLREIEIRKRLWHAIGLLDVQTALDRGTSPLLPADAFLDSPMMVDDHDLLRLTSSFYQNLGGSSIVTDMTFCSMTYEAMNVCRQICSSSSPRSEQADFDNKRKALQSFQKRFQVEYSTSTSQELIGRFTRSVTNAIVVTMELLRRRPLHKSHRATRPVSDPIDVLHMATELLEREEMKVAHTAFHKWRWFSWLKWFALSVVLAELCGRTDTPGVTRAWEAVDACFERYSSEIADSSGGMLWKPITKLCRRAMRERERAQPFAELDAEAMCWINWEAFVDDMNGNGVSDHPTGEQ
jgi:hypothetical protein